MSIVTDSFPFFRFGYHVVYDPSITNALDFAAAHQFGYIVPDLAVPRFFPENMNQDLRRSIKNRAESLGVSISLHAPGEGVDIVTLFPEIREAMLKRISLCLELARDLGAKRVTIHPSAFPSFASGGQLGTFLQDHLELYRNALLTGLQGILDIAPSDVQICVENSPMEKLTMEVLQTVFNERKDLYLTWDILKNQSPAHGDPASVKQFFLKHVDRVRECHLHDMRPGGRGHDRLGVSDLDFMEYVRLLAKHDVCFTLEIRPRENAYESLMMLKQAWPEKPRV